MTRTGIEGKRILSLTAGSMIGLFPLEVSSFTRMMGKRLGEICHCRTVNAPGRVPERPMESVITMSYVPGIAVDGM